jgi:D-hexose-6-phosphate mutarotase
MAEIIFNPQGGYLTSWKIEGREVLYQGSETKRTGIPFLFPNFDISDPLPKHGFGRLSLWRLISQTSSKVNAILSEKDISSDFQKLYPHQFSVELNISAEGNSLFYQFIVTNNGKSNLPITPALHPYWPINHTDKSDIYLNPKIFDPKSFDWDNSPPDEMFDFSGVIRLKLKDYSLSITDHTHQFKNLQLWSQNQTAPDYNFICLEPATRPKDSLFKDPIIISPNCSEDFFLQFTVSL